MSSSIVEGVTSERPVSKQLNPAELKIDLLCRGMLVDPACPLEQARPVCSLAGDLSSGLELILPGDMMELWVNVPVREKFVAASPYHLLYRHGACQIHDGRDDLTYPVKLAPNPDWYETPTRGGIPMSQVAFLGGTVLVVDLSPPCRFWQGEKGLACHFCRKAEAESEVSDKTIEDVVETALMARKKSGTTFALLRGGYDGQGSLARSFPYIKALKARVGTLIGLQFPAEPDFTLYDRARALGVDHFSFSLEFFNREYHQRLSPGKSSALKRESVLQAIEHCARTCGKGRVSVDMIAGIEPVEDTMRAVDYITGIGALPLVHIFRPPLGTEMEDCAAPDPAEMLRVFRHVYECCRSHSLPLGLLPNLHVSTLPHPLDTLYLAPDMEDSRSYRRWILTMKEMMRPYFLRRMRKHTPPQNA
jgi:uncharacterized radical SAM superfamily protein